MKRLRRGFVDTPDGQLHYTTAGDGPPLLLLHLTPDPRCFHGALPVFAERFRAIALDLPGYGDSDRPPAPYTDIAQFARAVLAAANGLGLDRFHLLGHMTGANMAAEVAALAPERIDRLVLSELFDWASRPEFRGSHATRFPAPTPEPDGAHLLAVWNQYAPMAPEVGLPIVQQRFWALFQALYKGPLAGAEVYGPGGWATAAPFTIETQPLADRLQRVTAPTLVLCAGQGVLRTGANPRLDRDRLAALLPNGEALTVDDLSHVAPYVAPERFAAIVTAFLAR